MRHASAIARTASTYERLFATAAGQALELDEFGALALERTAAYAPRLADEMEAIAAGAGVPATRIAALNARTEILALCRARGRGECSAVVVLGDAGAPLAIQTWDWHEELAEAWLVREVSVGGRIVRTFTEHGIVGKIGVSSAGLGVLFTILRHRADGESVGVPVHVVSRRILDEAATVDEALAIAAEADVSASTAITVVAADGKGHAEACSIELFPGGPARVDPDPSGVLVHTNHFLDANAAAGDEEPELGPDSLGRLARLREAFAGPRRPSLEQALERLIHHDEDAPVCCHVRPEAPFGERYRTLATVALDVAAGRMTVSAGGPCAGRTERGAAAAVR